MSSFLSRLNSPFAKAVLWLATGVALASAAFLATQASRRDFRPLQMVLRTYSVAPTFELPIQLALEDTLHGQGRIRRTGVDGQLLIAAPQSIHDQIPGLLASFGNAQSEAPTLLFDVWYVVATDGPANLEEPSLQSIRGTLDQIVKVDGAKRFEIRRRKAVRVQVGADAEADPVVAIRSPRLLKRADGTEVIAAGVDLGNEPGVDKSSPFDSRLKTRVEMVPGETIVISQTARKGVERFETLYELVRVSR